MTYTRSLEIEQITQGFRRFPSGVAAVCGMVGGIPTGMVVSSFTAVSTAPPLVSICPQNSSSTWPVLRTSERIGINVLAKDQADLCRSLASRKGDRFAGAEWEATEGGAIILKGSAAHFRCVLREEYPAGDHSVAILEVEALTLTDSAPLVYLDFGYPQLSSDRSPVCP